MQLNGLKLSNSWAGYHILLNPDYSAQILWRFVNRAIDEVENDRVLVLLPVISMHDMLIIKHLLEWLDSKVCTQCTAKQQATSLVTAVGAWNGLSTMLHHWHYY